MKYPRKRRPSHTYRWEGFVVDIDDGMFTARMIRVGTDWPEYLAEFDLARLPEAVPGLLITLYVHRRGHKVRSVLRAKRIRPLTAQEIAEIGARAEAWAAKVSKTWLAA